MKSGKLLISLVALLLCTNLFANETTPGCFYKVKKGDQLGKILRSFGFTRPFKDKNVDEFFNANTDQAKNKGDLIYPDTYLKVPMKYINKNNSYLCNMISEKKLPEKSKIIHLNVNQVITYNVKKVQKKPEHQKWKVHFIPGMIWQRIDGTQKANKTEADIISDLSPAYETKVDYQHNEKWLLGLNLGVRYYIFDDVTTQQVFNRPTHPGYFLGIYAKYNINKTFTPFLKLEFRQYLEYTVPKNRTIEMEENFNPTIFIGTDATLARFGNYNIDGNASLYYIIGLGEITNGFGYKFKLGVSKNFDNHNLGLYLGWEQLCKETDYVEMNQKELSLYLNYNIGF